MILMSTLVFQECSLCLYAALHAASSVKAYFWWLPYWWTPSCLSLLRQPQGMTTQSHFAESVVRFVGKQCVDGTTQEVTPHPPPLSSDPRSGTTRRGPIGQLQNNSFDSPVLMFTSSFSFLVYLHNFNCHFHASLGHCMKFNAEFACFPLLTTLQTFNPSSEYQCAGTGSQRSCMLPFHTLHVIILFLHEFFLFFSQCLFFWAFWGFVILFW